MNIMSREFRRDYWKERKKNTATACLQARKPESVDRTKQFGNVFT